MTQPLVLDANLTNFYGEELQESLLQTLEQEGSLVLDGQQVLTIDFSCLQLLVACAKLAADEGTPITWFACSERIHQAARVSGLSTHLGL